MAKENRLYFIVPITEITREIFSAAIEDSPRTTIYPAGGVLIKMPIARANALSLTGGLSLDDLHASGALDGARGFEDLSPEEQACLDHCLDLDPRRDRDSGLDLGGG